MYPISTLYAKYLERRDREWVVRASIAGVDYDSSAIVDFSIENSLSSSGEFEIGTAILSKLIISLRTITVIPPNAKVVPYLAISLEGTTWQGADFTWNEADFPWEGGNTEWMPLGEFYVDSREKINNVWMFTCYDKLVWADVPYISALTYPATMQQVWDELCTGLGYAYDSSVVINTAYTLPVGPAGYSKRQVMGYIAASNSASVYVGKDGKIKFRRYTAADTPVYTMGTSEYIKAVQTNPIKTFTRIVATYDDADGLSYSAGAGDDNHTLYIKNPFATQAIVNDLLALLNGFSYMPLQMDARGYPQLEAGDRITFRRIDSVTWEDANITWQDADFPWDGESSHQTVMLQMMFGFKGGLKMGIEAPSKSEQQSEFVVEGSLSQQVNRLNQNAVKKGKTYYGVTITDSSGLTVERSDHKSKVILNSDRFDWQVDGVSRLYYDSLANRIKFSGTLEGVDGTFSGTIQAGTIIGGTISGTTITGGFISGAAITGGMISGTTITGGMIQTQSSGTFPRITLASDSTVFKVSGSDNDEIRIYVSGSQPFLMFHNIDGTAAIQKIGNNFTTVTNGQIHLNSTGGVFANGKRLDI